MAVTASHVGGPFPGTYESWWFNLTLIPGSATADTALMIGLFYAALLALAVSWWLVVQASPGLSLRMVVALAALWAIPFVAGPALMSTDAYEYAAQGHLLVLGRNPYVASASVLSPNDPFLLATDPKWLHSRSPYGPLFLRIAQLAAILGQGNVIATIIWERVVACLGLALIAIAGVPLARRAGREPKQALALILLSPFTLINFVSAAHNDALMIGLIVAGISLAVVQRRLALGLLLCTAAQSVKTPALVSVGFVAWAWPGAAASLWHRVRVTAVSVVGSGAALVAMALAAGLGWGWLTLRVQWDATVSPAAKAGFALGRIFGTGTATALTIARTGGVLVAAIITVVLLLRSRSYINQRVTRGAVVALGLSLLAIAVLSPAYRPWYLLWCIALVALTTSSKRFVWLVLILSILGVANVPSG